MGTIEPCEQAIIQKTTLFINKLLAIFNIYTLNGLSLYLSALEVEVAVRTIGLNGSDGRADACCIFMEEVTLEIDCGERFNLTRFVTLSSTGEGVHGREGIGFQRFYTKEDAAERFYPGPIGTMVGNTTAFPTAIALHTINIQRLNLVIMDFAECMTAKQYRDSNPSS